MPGHLYNLKSVLLGGACNCLANAILKSVVKIQSFLKFDNLVMFLTENSPTPAKITSFWWNLSMISHE